MNALKCLLVAACGAVLLAPAASYGAEKNAAGFLSYASHDELVKAAKAESGTLQVTFAHDAGRHRRDRQALHRDLRHQGRGAGGGQFRRPDSSRDQGRHPQERRRASWRRSSASPTTIRTCTR